MVGRRQREGFFLSARRILQRALDSLLPAVNGKF